MNRIAAIGLSTVALIAAIALFVAGEHFWAGAAVMLSVTFDVVFVYALRAKNLGRKPD